MSEWYGYEIRDVLKDEPASALHIGPMPGRKQIALYTRCGNRVYPLAWFANEDAAREALGLLTKLTKASSHADKNAAIDEITGEKNENPKNS